MPNRDVFNDSTLMSITPPGPNKYGESSPDKNNKTYGTFDRFPNTTQQISENSMPTPIES